MPSIGGFCLVNMVTQVCQELRGSFHCLLTVRVYPGIQRGFFREGNFQGAWFTGHLFEIWALRPRDDIRSPGIRTVYGIHHSGTVPH